MSALVRRLRERTFRRLESGRILVGKRRTVRKVLERSEAPFLRAWVPSSFIESARCSWKFRHVHKHTHTHTHHTVSVTQAAISRDTRRSARRQSGNSTSVVIANTDNSVSGRIVVELCRRCREMERSPPPPPPSTLPCISYFSHTSAPNKTTLIPRQSK